MSWTIYFIVHDSCTHMGVNACVSEALVVLSDLPSSRGELFRRRNVHKVGHKGYAFMYVPMYTHVRSHVHTCTYMGVLE